MKPLHTRGDTKAITNSEWDWLENILCLEDVGISRHTPLVWLRAPLLLTTDAGNIIFFAVTGCIGLTPNTIKNVINISGEINSWSTPKTKKTYRRGPEQAGAFAHADFARHIAGFESLDDG